MDATLSPRQIVLAEDNPGDVGLVREALQEHNVHCDLRVIADGKEVLAFIDSLDANNEIPCPDLLLLDLSLPKHDGQEILQYLRASGRCSGTPVVILTASDWAGDHEKAEQYSALHYFRKPSSLGQYLKLGAIVKDVILAARTR